MKNLLKSQNLPLLAVVPGGIGFILRRLLYTIAVDQKNLIPFGHPLEILLWLVSIAAVVLVVAAVRKLDGSDRYEDNFGASPVSTVGAAALAAGIFITVWSSGAAVTGLEKARILLGYLSVAALAVIAVCRWQGKQPFFLLHTVVCIFFALHMVTCYRGWSGNPQLQDYVFTLFASIGLMLTAFYHAAFEVGSGKRRMQLGISLLTAFSCLVALSRTDNVVMYLAGGIWAVTNLCHPTSTSPEE